MKMAKTDAVGITTGAHYVRERTFCSPPPLSLSLSLRNDVRTFGLHYRIFESYISDPQLRSPAASAACRLFRRSLSSHGLSELLENCPEFMRLAAGRAPGTV